MKIKSIVVFFFLCAVSLPRVSDCFSENSPTLETKDAPPAEKTVSPLEEETERLMQLMIDRGYARLAQDEKDIKNAAIEFPPQNTLIAPAYDEISKMKALEPKPDRIIYKMYQRHKLKEGEDLYRVAVADKILTLKEAIDVGVANNLVLRAQLKKVEVARAKLSEARRALFPTVAGVVEFTGGKAGASGTNIGGRLYKGKSYKVNVQQPLFYGGELVLTAKQAESNLRSAQAEYEKTKGEYLTAVNIAYYGVVKAEYNTQYQTTLYNEVETIYKRARLERQKKVISDIDFLNAQSQYHQIFFTLETVKNDLLSAKLSLFQALALDYDDDAQLDLHLEFKKVDVDLEDVLDIALHNNADIRMKELALESAELGIKIYKAKKLPKLDLRGSMGKLGEVFKDDKAIADDNMDLDTEREWFLGFGGSMPLGASSVEYETIKHHYGPTALALQGSEDWKHKITYNLFDKFAEITDEKNAEATYLQAVADSDKARNDTILKVKDEYYNMQKALIQIDSSLSKLRYQEKQVAASRYLASFGEVTAAAMFETLNELATAKFSFIQAAADYHLAVAALNGAMGDFDHFQSRP
ncbi:MAG TPA: TolC family protein [Candidatus Eisenbacteria bacterium]|jgi:outer membrane protein TolC|nr:TolC family protein [Candidatus Eisenbacteria bacterium]